ncbi:hypothetical protein MKW92_032617 [Papaver armeniacum]|nr:hypothetical protein MKW92_032617 [Papaver armeniacum]
MFNLLCDGRFVVEKNSLRVTCQDSIKDVYEYCYFTLKAWNAQKAGAAAVLVSDDKLEPLITMDTPEEENASAEYLQNITIPSALISRSLGIVLRRLWRMVTWAAQILEQKGYTQFTPHYITWYCPEAFVLSRQCKSQCINHRRYCAPDPEQDFSTGYDGKDVVVQNLRQVCLHKVANESGKPWLWWDYVTRNVVINSLFRLSDRHCYLTYPCEHFLIGVDLKKIDACIGDPGADVEEPSIEKGSGDIAITLLVISKLDKGAVLKAICSGFQETTEPAVCLSDGIETNECLENNGGCWQDKAANATACKDTFRGRVCECPVVQGVKFVGDGYTHCEASGHLRCEINNGGCWKQTKDGKTFSACSEEHSTGCKCPPGFKGDGVQTCEDVDECRENSVCQCTDYKMQEYLGDSRLQLVVTAVHASKHLPKWKIVSWLELCVGHFLSLAITGVAGYAVYKYRIRYMPLDNQGESQNHVAHADI